jgi:uncharacterized protein YjbI with pentapeptide repeats
VLRRANLSGADLRRANLEGANLEGANLEGANLKFAQLDSANLAGANLKGANFGQADLSECYLGGVQARGALFARATLRGATLEEADLSETNFDEALLVLAVLRKVVLVGASLGEADLSRARLSGVDLSRADLRRAVLKGARLEGSSLTGAKIHRADFADATFSDVRADFLDRSRDGDDSERITFAAFLQSLQHPDEPAPNAGRRYIGATDVLKNAEFDFGDGAEVQVDGRLEGCSITLAPNASLIIGETGVLERCQVKGGNIEVHGRFLETSRIGFLRPGQLLVSVRGAVSTTVEQPPTKTRFGFASGCRLRLNIKDPSQAA